MEELISILLHSRTQTHIWHLRVEGEGSFAQHMALQEYYEDIICLIDGLSEAYQGKYGLMTFKQTSKLDNDASLENMISYFDNLCKLVEKHSNMDHEGFIHNYLDDISSLLYQTKYKLAHLQ